MTKTETKSTTHLTEADIAGYLARTLPTAAADKVEHHIAGCNECLAAVACAYESVETFKKKDTPNKKASSMMKKINVYPVLALLSFALSFVTPRYFIQLLVATLLLGIKWIVDAKSTKMLVMIYEAWKQGGEKEASRVLERMEKSSGMRF